jgi:cytochrome c oxidase assembly factor CtaG
MCGLAFILGAAFLLTGPLYPAYADQTTRLLGLTPLADQQLAGLLMIAEQVAALTVCSAVLLPARGTVRMSRERRSRPAEALL